MFTVLILTYGDHQPLIKRCLESIIKSADWSLIADVRIGCNAVTEATVSYLQYAQSRVQAPCWLVHEHSGKNVGKYPMMRRMLYDPKYPITTPYVMWFDDDSYIFASNSSWWRNLANRLPGHALAGKRYRISVTPQQRQAIYAQSWFGNKPIEKPYTVRFCTGGWWTAAYDVLKAFDYPFPEIFHNGGDVILGELCRQQELNVLDTNDGIAINADDLGRESKATRRGLTTKPLWRDYVPGRQPDLSHHNFTHRYSPGNPLAIRDTLVRPDAESD